MRGISPGSTLYPWVLSMVEVMDKCSPDDVYWSTLHGALDFLANGVTSAYNFTHSRVTWRYDPVSASPALGRVAPVEFVTRQLDAVADAGLRVVNAIRLDDEAGPEDEMLGVFGDMVRESALRTPADQHLGASVMGAVQWASAPRSAELEVAVMREHGITNQAHFVETAQGIETQREKFAWYRSAGAFGPDFLFGHFVHPTDEMVDVAASTGCGVVWQATSNGRLGSGFADVVRLREAGIRVGLGLDDQSCTDISDPWGNMRIGLYSTRALHTDASVLMPADVLRMHTLGAAEVLGVQDRIGSLEVGKLRRLPAGRPPVPGHRAGLGRAGHLRDGVRAAEPHAGVRRRRARVGARTVDVRAGRGRARRAAVADHGRRRAVGRRAAARGARGTGLGGSVVVAPVVQVPALDLGHAVRPQVGRARRGRPPGSAPAAPSARGAMRTGWPGRPS